MNHFMKKVVSLALAALMVFSMPGMTALAEDNADTVQNQELDGTDEGTSVDSDQQGDEEEVASDVDSETSGGNEEGSGEETGTDLPDDAGEGAEDDEAALVDELSEEDEIQNLDIFEEYAVEASIYDDVSESDWFCPYVSFVMNKGIMTGTGNNLFSPLKQLSRAEFATVLYRLAGSPKVSYNGKFSDVKSGNYYTDPVAWASQSSVAIVLGDGNGRFWPDNMITREDMAVMLYRYAVYYGFDVSESVSLDAFTDAKNVSAYAKDAVKWAVGSGIIKGTTDTTLTPQGKTTRAECATMLMRFCNKYMQGQFANIDLSASCSSVTAKVTDVKNCTFKITVTDAKAAAGIQKVQAIVYSKSDKSDKYIYDLALQQDGSYQVTGAIAKHNYNFGTYTVEAAILLSNGVRIPVGSTTVTVEKTIDAEIYTYVNKVYASVGRDLNKCYLWVVNNMSYQTLPIPMEPPAGYTSCQNYALYAFKNHKGNCYCYAAAFYYLAEGLGYDAEYIEGQVGMAGGGYGPHGWVAIYQDGSTYICDPEAQDEPRLKNYKFYWQSKSNPILNYKWPE